MMSLQEAQAIRERACVSKIAYGRETAHAIPGQIGYDGHRRLSAYRCPFDGTHWHVGHLLSPEGMRVMAEAVRVLAGNGPGSASGNVPKAERRAARRRLREPQSAPDVSPPRSPQPTGSGPLRSTGTLSPGDREFVESVGRGFDRMAETYRSGPPRSRRFAEVFVEVRAVRTREVVREHRRRRS